MKIYCKLLTIINVHTFEDGYTIYKHKYLFLSEAFYIIEVSPYMKYLPKYMLE